MTDQSTLWAAYDGDDVYVGSDYAGEPLTIEILRDDPIQLCFNAAFYLIKDVVSSGNGDNEEDSEGSLPK